MCYDALMSETQTQFKVTYLRGQGYPVVYVKMDTILVYPHRLDQMLEDHDPRTIVDIVEVPWCGWVNSWKDSGDRGAAQADHDRDCDICPVL
jgi:hypothetical protein